MSKCDRCTRLAKLHPIAWGLLERAYDGTLIETARAGAMARELLRDVRGDRDVDPRDRLFLAMATRAATWRLHAIVTGQGAAS